MTFSKIFSKVKLSASARLILRCLIDFYNPSKGLVYPGQKMIAECTGVSQRSITNAVEELRQQGIILTTKKINHLNYHFTKKFFELAGIADTTSNNCSQQIAKTASTCNKQHEDKQKKNNIFSFQLTEFQKRYMDVFEKLSDQELSKYKSLQGFEKESYLQGKRKEHAQAVASRELQIKLESDKHNTGSPLNFTKDQAIEYLNNLMPELRNSYFARELRAKWML